MSSDGLGKIKAVLEREDVERLRRVGNSGSRVCPACDREYPAESNIVVCEKDRTLLMKFRGVEKKLDQELAGSLSERRYQVQHFVGEGDLTRVYFANDMQTWQEVVIKAIKPHLLGTPRRIRRFADALQETTALQHPGIVTVLDSGIAGESEGSVPQVYFVVEKLKASKNLKTILHQSGPIAPYVVIETMVKTCEILDFAASKGWLHKDIKPSNIFISLEGEQVAVKVADFGVAERMFHNLEWEGGGNDAVTRSMYGNAAYIAPEIAFGMGGSRGGGEHTAVSDIYSLGCTMYHVLKGMQPFEGNNDFDTLLQHGAKPPRAFADELGVPKELEAIVMKCLSKDPKSRYQDFGELGRALNGVS
ncbi:MAG: serine/threonine-protein kinase [Candidatus Obscuribacterales bacterium]